MYKRQGLLFKRTLPITSGLTGWGSPLSIWQNIAETSNQGGYPVAANMAVMLGGLPLVSGVLHNGCPCAVSYTHLDVYKRQLRTRSGDGS